MKLLYETRLEQVYRTASEKEIQNNFKFQKNATKDDGTRIDHGNFYLQMVKK